MRREDGKSCEEGRPMMLPAQVDTEPGTLDEFVFRR